MIVIEELDDIIEELADKLELCDCDCTCSDDCNDRDLYDQSRSCWSGEIKNRIRKALEMEDKLKRQVY